jgi:signal transduction histidine kinase
MRWAVARLALAVTSMVALAFLIPLALVAREIARERAMADAHQEAAGIVAVLAVSDERDVLVRAVAATGAGAAGRLAVYLPDQPPAGTTRAPVDDVSLARLRRQPLTAPVPHGVAYLQPVALDGGRTAVIEVFVPDATLNRGVVPAWLAIAGLAVALVGGSVLAADRLGARLVSAARGLARATRAFGSGDLSARVTPTGPAELVEAGTAFNTMADRVIAFVDAERELAADLSHRLRTPLTALRLDAERLADGPVGDRVRGAVRALEEEIDAIIAGARQGTLDRAREGTDLVEVLADRLAFWAVLAEDHQRRWQVRGAERPVWVPVPRADLVAAIDALLGNVFEHTPQGTRFQIAVSPHALVVEDAGPGIFDVASALRRGSSGSGSTGLGLSIVRRVAENAGGDVRVDRGELGGARITLILPATTGQDQPGRPAT